MSYSELPLDERISVFRQSINNALAVPELKSRLESKGYPETRLNEAKEIGEEVQNRDAAQKREYGDQYRATEIFSKEDQSLREDIRDFRTIARVVFKSDHDAKKALNLDVNLKRSFDGFRTQTETMVKNAIESETILTALFPYSYTVDTFQDLLSRVRTLPDLRTIRDNESREAQEATRQRDAMVDKMDEWFVDLLTIAPIAVKDKPELMELLGVVVPS